MTPLWRTVFVAALALTVASTAYWILTGLLSPLYTVGGVNQGWILVGHAWLTVIALIAGGWWGVANRQRNRWFVTAALTAFGPVSFGVVCGRFCKKAAEDGGHGMRVMLNVTNPLAKDAHHDQG